MNSFNASLISACLCISGLQLKAQQVMPLEKRLEQAHEKFLEERRARFKFMKKFAITPKKEVAPTIKINERWENYQYPWRRNVQALIFWIGQPTSPNNPIANDSSAWNPDWKKEFGGIDDPLKRNGFEPSAFEPKSNPFYIALPYNDLDHASFEKAEAPEVIPWYWRVRRNKFQSVCQNRWLALHYRGKICFAQWKDVGPKYDDDWKYVFRGDFEAREKGDQPRILISPAIRDYLQVAQGRELEWKFVENYEVPSGPWRQWL